MVLIPVVYQELITFGVSVVFPDPGKLTGVELDIAPTQGLQRRHTLHDRVQCGPVLRSLRRHPVGGLHADRTRHIDGHDRRLAGNVAAHMAGQETCPQIVVSAR